MEIGMVGLGRMGASMAKRLAQGNHRVVAYDILPEDAQALAKEEPRISPSDSLEALTAALTQPRTVWIMVPSSGATESVIGRLADILSPGDTIIDGGNSNYADTVWRAESLKARGLDLVDVGTSGGVWGISEGYCMMIGGEEQAVERLRPIFETLAPGKEDGWGRVGPSGAGHFAKMVHNGIEYGLMEAYAEGFEILRAKREFEVDLRRVAEIWRHGSVIRSWLLDLTSAALSEDPDLKKVRGWVDDTGEGRWTAKEAIDQDVPAPVISLALMMRFASRQDQRYADKLIAALRQQFGGHEVKKDDDDANA